MRPKKRRFLTKRPCPDCGARVAARADGQPYASHLASVRHQAATMRARRLARGVANDVAAA